MPRKSQALRLQQAQDLIAAYGAAGAGGTGLRFMNDMVSSMTRGKYPTKRQRDWLDRLIDEGVPESKGDEGLLTEMNAAVEAFEAATEFDWEVRTLRDFAHRERQGWKLSEKQVALRDRILKKANDLRAGEIWLTVTPPMRVTLENATKLYKGYSELWKRDRPAVMRAMARAVEFLNAGRPIEQYHYDKVVHAMRSPLRQLENPRFNEGDLGFMNLPAGKECWMCASDTYVSSQGEIVNQWITCSGAIETLNQDAISKR